MKTIFVFTLIALMLPACTNLKKSPSGPIVETKKVSETRQTHGVVWDYLQDSPLKIYLLNLDNQQEKTFELRTGIQEYKLSPGTWQIMGFTLNGKNYETLLTAQNFVFKAFKDKDSYVGSLIFQCPRVGNKYNSLLKNHKFFNRYPFRNNSGLCEMIVGNDFASVQKKKKLPLILGF